MKNINDLSFAEIGAGVLLAGVVLAGVVLYQGSVVKNFNTYVSTTLANAQERYKGQNYSTLTKADAVDGGLFSTGFTITGSGATATIASNWGAVDISKHTINVANDSVYLKTDSIPSDVCLKAAESYSSPYLYIGGTAAANKVRDPVVNKGALNVSAATTLCNAASTVSMYFATK
jgi:hypothetical protein